jgi:hypothetical protein
MEKPTIEEPTMKEQDTTLHLDLYNKVVQQPPRESPWCIRIITRGANKGKACNNPTNSNEVGFCTLHRIETRDKARKYRELHQTNTRYMVKIRTGIALVSAGTHRTPTLSEVDELLSKIRSEYKQNPEIRSIELNYIKVFKSYMNPIDDNEAKLRLTFGLVGKNPKDYFRKSGSKIEVQDDYILEFLNQQDKIQKLTSTSVKDKL